MAHEEVKIENLPYSPLNEDASSLAAGTVNVQLDDNATVPSNDYKFTCKTCCCGKMSLRCGCILIAALYTLYSLFYIGLIITFLIMLDLHESYRFAIIWNLNMAIFEAYFSVFALVFLCLGIRKLDYRRILVSKWIMVVHMIMNIVIQIRIITMDHWIFAINHVVFFLILPAFTIIYLHSYEAEIWKLHRKSEGIPTLLKHPPKLEFQIGST